MSDDQRASEGEFINDATGSNAFRPSRRKVLAVTAWTVPAIIIGTAAPALAASTPPVLPESWGPFCKHGPQDGDDGPAAWPTGVLHLASEWTNTFTSDVDVTVVSIQVNNKTYTDGLYVTVDGVVQSTPEFTIQAETAGVPVVIHDVRTLNANNITVIVNYRVNGIAYSVGSGERPIGQCSLAITN